MEWVWLALGLLPVLIPVAVFLIGDRWFPARRNKKGQWL